jgi:ABC transport system ATP-binding/permease protein
MARVFITTGEGRIYGMPLLKKEATIGRSQDNDVVLPDQTVSRKHARITKSENGYLLTDLGSFNGTFVNDRPVREAPLNHKDRIKIGLNEITFLAREEWVSTPPGTFVLSTETDFEKDMNGL